MSENRTEGGATAAHLKRFKTMSIGLCFYILLLIWLVFGFAIHGGLLAGYGLVGNSILLFALFLLLGWKVFGPPLHG